ncbi:MAG: hypoxanthine phosphoribosyltransferase [Dehalococcoidales bacterium]
MSFKENLTVLYGRNEIDFKVRQLAQVIKQDYEDKNPLFVSVLKGSFIFMADLARQLDFPLEIEFVRLSSYNEDTKSSGKINIVQDISFEVKNRHVLIVEDIVDSGLTVKFLKDMLEEQQAASVRVCALTNKPSRRTCAVDIDYLGFSVPDKFIVGYGLDLNQKFRNLPDICVLDEPKQQSEMR